MTAPAPTLAGRRLRPLAGLAAAALTAVLIGVPTDIIANPVFGRDVPVRPWEAPVLAATAVLTGAYFALQPRGGERLAPAMGPAGLAMFAVACPVCNKIVLLTLGASGALGVFAPVQPYLAGISLVLLAAAVAWAWRRNPCAAGRCAEDPRAAAEPAPPRGRSGG